MLAVIMQEFNSHKHFLWLCLGLLIVPGWFSAAWGQHENLPCATCHNKNAAELKEYVHDNSEFPISARCLACHDGSLDVSGLNPPHVMNGQKGLAGGSFTPGIFADNVGHNILSIDRILGLTPPGGASLDDFGCLSCHDGHHNGNYRNLKKEINGYTTPVEADGDPDYQQNLYIDGMNNFCGACHVKFSNPGIGRGPSGWRRHPVGISIAGATHADFEHWSRLTQKVTQAEHPSGNSDNTHDARVFCLSCHRAHASPFKDAMRWDHGKTARGCQECHTF